MKPQKDILISTGDRLVSYLYGASPKNLTAMVVTEKYDEVGMPSIPEKYKDVPIYQLDKTGIVKEKHTHYIYTPMTIADGKVPPWCKIYALREKHPVIELAMKRCLDIFGASVGLLCSLPIWLIAAPLVKMEGGPIFFAQARVGYNRKPFFCLKFRTMVPNAEEKLEALLQRDPEAKEEYERFKKLKNDPRCTRMGRFLRYTSLDEIPQLINVLKGEMSLVGPRPIIPSERKDIREDEYALYCSVRPGLTGFWQVSGRNQTSFRQRMHCDRFYIEQWSFWFDIKILWKTVGVFLSRKGAH